MTSVVPDGEPLVKFFFRLSSTAVKYELTTFDLQAWLGLVGGFASAILSLFGIVWGEIGRVIYYRTIMRSLFFYKSSIFAKGEVGASARPDGDDSEPEMEGGDRPFHRQQTTMSHRDSVLQKVGAPDHHGDKKPKNAKLSNLESSLAYHGKPDERNIKHIVSKIIQERAPLGARQSYLKFVLLYIMTYIPIPLPFPKFRKKMEIFRRGKQKLQDELDIIQLVKAVRQNKIMTRSQTTKTQRLLMQF